MRGVQNTRRIASNKAPDMDADRIGSLVTVQTLELLDRELRTGVETGRFEPASTEAFGFKSDIKNMKKKIKALPGKVDNVLRETKNVPTNVRNKIRADIRFIVSKIDKVSRLAANAPADVQRRVRTELNTVIGKINSLTNITKNIPGNVGRRITSEVGKLGAKVDSIGRSAREVPSRVRTEIKQDIDRISNLTQGLPDKVGEKVRSQLSSVTAKVDKIITLTQKIPGKISEDVADIMGRIDGLTDIIKEIPGSVRREIQEVLDDLPEQFADVLDQIQSVANQVGDRVMEEVKDIPGKLSDLVDSVQDISQDIWEGTEPLQDWIVERFLKIAGWLEDHIIDPAVGEYKDVRLGVKNVIATIKRNFGSLRNWWIEVILKDVSSKNNPGLNGLIMIRNWMLWVFTLVDRGIVFITKSVLAGYLLFLDKISLAASKGFLRISRSVTTQGTRAFADDATFDDFVRAFPVDSTRDLIQMAWNGLTNNLAGLVKTIFDDIEKRFKEAGGDIPGLSEFLPLSDLAKLGALEAENIPPEQKLAKRIPLLLKITGKFFLILTRKIITDILAPILKAMITLVLDIFRTTVRTAIRVGRPVLNKVLKILTAPQQIMSYLILEGINVAHDELLMAKGVDARKEGRTLHGDKIRFFANTFGIKNDLGSVLFFWTLSLLGGAGLTGATYLAGKKIVGRFKKEAQVIVEVPGQGLVILGTGPITPKTVAAVVGTAVGTSITGKVLLSLPLPQKRRPTKDPFRFIFTASALEADSSPPKLIPDRRPVDILGLVQVPGPNMRTSSIQELIQWSQDIGDVEDGILCVNVNGEIRLVDDPTLCSDSEESLDADTHGDRIAIFARRESILDQLGAQLKTGGSQLALPTIHHRKRLPAGLRKLTQDRPSPSLALGGRTPT